MPAGTVFEVFKDGRGEYRFRLKQGDTIIAISSKGYESKEDLQKVIGSVQKEAAKAKIVEAKDDKDKKEVAKEVTKEKDKKDVTKEKDKDKKDKDK
jgi:uncharacterized protein YegP (UPF0339 family)